MRKVAIVGTGFLGRVLAKKFEGRAVSIVHTFNQHPTFSSSIQFDMLRQDIASVLPLSDLDMVIFASGFENCSDNGRVYRAMRRSVEHLKDKRVIYISSDAVFDGSKGMYCENDLPAPRTTYGINKLLCEELVRHSIPDYCIARTSYIYGYSLGILDPRLAQARQKLRDGEVLERFEDMHKSPVEVTQLADAIVAISESNFSGTIHIAGDRMSVYEFHRRALGAMGESGGNIRPTRIPPRPPPEFLVDTSLDISLSKRVIGFIPATIESSLRQHRPLAHDSVI
jgi:dTDP-4-dehydrorhamnose reductase